MSPSLRVGGSGGSGVEKNNATTEFGLCTFHNNKEMRSLCA